MGVVRIIMDYWQKMIEVKMDTNIINAMIQSLATILAVAVGFLFSTFTDRRQWKRVKSEQIRTYQLSALLDLTYQIQRVVLILEKTRFQHNNLYNIEKRYENIQNLSEIRKHENVLSLEGMIKPIEELKCEINKKILELRLLNYKKENICIANDCVVEIDNILEQIFSELFENELDENIFDSLKKKLDRLIEEAENGLRQ